MAARQNSGSIKQNQRYAKKWQGIDRAALWIAGLIIAAVVGYVLFSLLGGFNMIEQRKMESYLKSKYGEEFVVENYRVEGAGLGVEGDPTADAYLRKNKSLKFEVWDRGRYNIGEHEYSDGYINSVWSNDLGYQWRDRLARIFGFAPQYKVIVGANVSLASYKALPGFNEARIKYPENLSVELRIYNDQLRALDKDSASQVWQSIQLLKETGLRDIRFYYCKDNDNCTLLRSDDISKLDTQDQLLKYWEK